MGLTPATRTQAIAPQKSAAQSGIASNRSHTPTTAKTRDDVGNDPTQRGPALTFMAHLPTVSARQRGNGEKEQDQGTEHRAPADQPNVVVVPAHALGDADEQA